MNRILKPAVALMAFLMMSQASHAQLIASIDYGYPQLTGIELEYQTALRVAPYVELGFINRALGLRTYSRRGINVKSAVGVQMGQTAMVDVGGGPYVSSYFGLYRRFNRIQLGLEGGGVYGIQWLSPTTPGQSGDVLFPHVQFKVGYVFGRTRFRPSVWRQPRSRR